MEQSAVFHLPLIDAIKKRMIAAHSLKSLLFISPSFNNFQL